METYQIIIVYSQENRNNDNAYNLALYCTAPNGKTEYITETEIVVSGYSKLLDYCINSCSNYYNKEMKNIKILDTRIKKQKRWKKN